MDNATLVHATMLALTKQNVTGLFPMLPVITNFQATTYSIIQISGGTVVAPEIKFPTFSNATIVLSE